MSSREQLGHSVPRRFGTVDWYVALVVLIAAVNDGWSGRPSPFVHQLLVLPFSIAFATGLYMLLRRRPELPSGGSDRTRILRLSLVICGIFEISSLAGFWYERHHFARYGYTFGPFRAALMLGIVIAAAILIGWRRSGATLLGAATAIFGAGLLLAILSFPLNYLRSDMLPVILWSDRRLALGLNPYATIHIGSRLYDFPYLPGMLVAYLPVIALHLDPRYLNLVCVLLLAWVVYRASAPGRNAEAAALIAIFLLSPFLQYRHDLYLAPHWLALTGAFVLAQKGRHIWAAVVFGISMAIYQLSWVLFPFLLLYAFRRRGWAEVMKLAAAAAASFLVILGPFLSVAAHRVASNTVSQWSRLPHALADPMNISYWLTFLVRPDQLKWLQLAAMTGIFLFCIARGRCSTLTDTLRWMSGALALFIAMNVIVDGYFYLTLSVVMLIFTCLQTGLWRDPDTESRGSGAQSIAARTSLA